MLSLKTLKKCCSHFFINLFFYYNRNYGRLLNIYIYINSGGDVFRNQLANTNLVCSVFGRDQIVQ